MKRPILEIKKLTKKMNATTEMESHNYYRGKIAGLKLAIRLEPRVSKPTEMIVNLDVYRTKISKEGRMLVISSDGDLVIKVKAENKIWIEAE